MKTPHHLVPRSLGGDDVPACIASLCAVHHVGNEGWHTLGGLEWYRRFKDRMSDELRTKVEMALGL